MEKSKLGISICLLSALAFLSGIAGILTVAVVAGYILLREENKSLRSNAVSSLILCVLFTLLSYAISSVSNLISIIDFGSWMWDVEFFVFLKNLINALSLILSLAEKVIFALLAFFALFGKNVKLPIISKMVEKHL